MAASMSIDDPKMASVLKKSGRRGGGNSGFRIASLAAFNLIYGIEGINVVR